MDSAPVNVYKMGFVIGSGLGALHLCWCVLVAIGWAQAIADFIFWMHFIKPVYIIEPFEASRALILVLVTSAIGFVAGALAGVVCNLLRVV